MEKNNKNRTIIIVVFSIVFLPFFLYVNYLESTTYGPGLFLLFLGSGLIIFEAFKQEEEYSIKYYILEGELIFVGILLLFISLYIDSDILNPDADKNKLLLLILMFLVVTIVFPIIAWFKEMR
jgi:hypothetical protein